MSAPLSPEDTAAAFASGTVARTTTRDVVSLAGPDARAYLQGQCSQDLDGLGVGEARDALVLSVQGKLEALVRIVAVAEDHLLVVVAPGFGEAVEARLRKFKIRVKADLSLATWPAADLRGPGAAAVHAAAPGPGPDGVAVSIPWPGISGVELLGSAVEAAAGVPEGDPETFEAARIEAGVPAMGSELDERTIPQEAGLVEATVSFTKGCYTGQELVARIDARGNRVPRVLRGVLLETPPAPADPSWRPEPGTELVEGDRAVGHLTSVAFSPFRGGLVALGYCRRGVDPPTRLELAGPGGVRIGAQVEALPLEGAPR